MSSKNIFFVFVAVDNHALAAAFVNGIFINVFTDCSQPIIDVSRIHALLCISGRNIFGDESEDEAGSFLHLLAAQGLIQF